MLKNAKFLMKVSTNSTSLSFKLRPGISESKTAAWRQHTLSTYMFCSVALPKQPESAVLLQKSKQSWQKAKQVGDI